MCPDPSQSIGVRAPDESLLIGSFADYVKSGL